MHKKRRRCQGPVWDTLCQSPCCMQTTGGDGQVTPEVDLQCVSRSWIVPPPPSSQHAEVSTQLRGGVCQAAWLTKQVRLQHTVVTRRHLWRPAYIILHLKREMGILLHLLATNMSYTHPSRLFLLLWFFCERSFFWILCRKCCKDKYICSKSTSRPSNLQYCIPWLTSQASTLIITEENNALTWLQSQHQALHSWAVLCSLLLIFVNQSTNTGPGSLWVKRCDKTSDSYGGWQQ